MGSSKEKRCYGSFRGIFFARKNVQDARRGVLGIGNGWGDRGGRGATGQIGGFQSTIENSPCRVTEGAC